MEKQKVVLGLDAKKKLLKGVNILSEAVVSSLGPGGRNTIYFNDDHVALSTKDGVTIARQIKQLEDPIENIGSTLVKQASIKTANEAGDGTTTATLLAAEFINEGFKGISQGINPVEVKRGMDLAVVEVKKYLKKISKEISSEEQLEQVATISANGDEEVGRLISAAMEKVGREGVVTLEESKTGETYLESVEGMQFDRGYKSPYLVTHNANMTSVLENPYILIYDKRILQIKELLPILDFVSKQDRSILIIAEDIDHEALATLIVNKMRGILKICAVKAPEFGDRRKETLQDIATLTGGMVISPDKGMKLDKFDPTWLGESRTATISKDTTTIVDGKGTEENIVARVTDLKKQLDNASSSYDKQKLQERLAKMAGGVAIVHVGAHTEVEMKEKKDRVDDALHATKAALDEGILPGGGIALLKASDTLKQTKFKSEGEAFGYKIVKKTLEIPFIKIMSNLGDMDAYKQAAKVVGLKDPWKGYNYKTSKYGNMLDFGVLDPLKVTRCALENATSIASTVLLTDCVVYTELKKEEVQSPVDNMGGGF